MSFAETRNITHDKIRDGIWLAVCCRLINTRGEERQEDGDTEIKGLEIKVAITQGSNFSGSILTQRTCETNSSSVQVSVSCASVMPRGNEKYKRRIMKVKNELMMMIVGKMKEGR